MWEGRRGEAKRREEREDWRGEKGSTRDRGEKREKGKEGEDMEEGEKEEKLGNTQVISDERKIQIDGKEERKR